MGTGKRKRALAAKRRYWGRQIKAWGESGLSQAEYCRRHELAAHRLNYWVKKLGRPGASEVVPPVAAADLVEVKWDEAVVESTGPGLEPLRVRIGERFVIEVGGDFDEAVFEKLAASLDRLC